MRALLSGFAAVLLLLLVVARLLLGAMGVMMVVVVMSLSVADMAAQNAGCDASAKDGGRGGDAEAESDETVRLRTLECGCHGELLLSTDSTTMPTIPWKYV